MLKKYLTLASALLFVILACRRITEPLFEKINPRDYKWGVDTLAHPNSMQNMMRTIWASSANNVYIAGHTSADGDMYHYNGKKWDEVDLNSGSLSFAKDMSGQVFGFGKNEIWATGLQWFDFVSHLRDSSLILHYDGKGWKNEPFDIRGERIQTIWGLSKDELWAGGKNGYFYKYDQGVWRYHDLKLPKKDDLDPQMPYYIQRISGNKSGDAYMYIRRIYPYNVEESLFYKYTEDKQWALHDSTWRYTISIWVSPSGVLYAGGSGLWKYLDNTMFDVLKDVTVIKIFGTSEDNLFVVAYKRWEGYLMHFNGEDWHTFEGVKADIFTDIWTDGEEVFLIGYINTPQAVKTVVWHGK